MSVLIIFIESRIPKDAKVHKDSPFKFYQKRTDFLRQFNVNEIPGNMSQFKKKNDTCDVLSALLLC